MVPAVESSILAPHVSSLKIHAYLSPPVLSLTITGPLSLGAILGLELEKHNLRFTKPRISISMAYHNPHGWMDSEKKEGEKKPVEGKQEEQKIQDKISAIYESITPHDALPLADQPKKLLTGLFPHQKQALHFMRQREGDMESSTERLLRQLSQKDSIRVCRGGILADDMVCFFLHRDWVRLLKQFL